MIENIDINVNFFPFTLTDSATTTLTLWVTLDQNTTELFSDIYHEVVPIFLIYSHHPHSIWLNGLFPSFLNSQFIH